MTQTVAEWVNSDVLTVTPNTPMSEAIKLLVDRQRTALAVVNDEKKLVGILSESDLMWREAGVEQPPHLLFLGGVIYFQNPATYDRDLHKALGQTVGEVMTPDPISIHLDTTLPAAARIMHEKRIHHLPIVDANQIPIGMLTQHDLVRAIAAV
jgi:CBS domain-containing protein